MMDLHHGDTELIVEACLAAGLLRNQCAYVLATAWHETAHTMEPVRERGGETYLKAKKYYPFVGMGYVQLTWKDNYEKAGKRLGEDFVKNPRLLLLPRYAAPILVIGMQEGWFTGKKLSDYMTLRKSDFHGARRIVNGMDRADLIADHAKQFNALLLAAGYGVEKKPVGAPKPVPAPPSPPLEPAPQAKPALPIEPGKVVVVVPSEPKPHPRNRFLAWLIDLITAIFWPERKK